MEAVCADCGGAPSQQVATPTWDYSLNMGNCGLTVINPVVVSDKHSGMAPVMPLKTQEVLNVLPTISAEEFYRIIIRL